MAFKNLSLEVLEEFVEVSSGLKDTIHTAQERRSHHLAERRRRQRAEQRERARFLIKVAHPIVASCAVCRESFVNGAQVQGHFTQRHAALDRAYSLHLATASKRHQLARELARAERRLAAARDLHDACQAAVDRLAARLRTLG